MTPDQKIQIFIGCITVLAVIAGPYGQEIQATCNGFKAFWSGDGFHQILGRICLHQTARRGGGGRGCRLIGLQKASLESASTRRVP
jgi:hypothetical protein